MNDFRSRDEEDLTEDWAFLFPDDPPKQTPPKQEEVNWDDYNFNFDDEFGDYAPQARAPRRPASQTGGAYSVDALRRVHESEAVVEPAYPRPAAYNPPPQAPRRPAKRRRRFSIFRLLRRVILALLLVLVLAVALLLLLAKMPQTDRPIAERKPDCTTILLAGTDLDGTRTDTVMLLYLDRSAQTMRLLSIPRDTMVNRDNPVPKINGAYGANGSGSKGMEALMDYVQDLIGYRPDGYMLIDFTCFTELVDLMGGVEFDVPMDMQYDDPAQDLHIDLKEGLQRLNGEQAMWLVRFRSGYAMADLTRVSVQQEFLRAAVSQWSSALRAVKLPSALSLLLKNTVTDLDTRELVWLARALVRCRGNTESDTLPGYGDYIGGVSYYIESVSDASALINAKYNPYQTAITADMLHPYGR